MHSLSRNAVLALIGVTLVLHTAEEYLTFPNFLSSPSGLPRWLPPPRLLLHSQDLHVALVMATVLPLAVIVWAILRSRKALLVLVLLLESILLVNAGWHILVLIRGGCSRSRHRGVDQPAVWCLRATKGSQGAVDWNADGMATGRHRARAAYRRCGQLASRMSSGGFPLFLDCCLNPRRLAWQSAVRTE